MNEAVKAYLRLESIVSAAFNFFINGMVSALIYHKADWVPTDAVSIFIDLTLTCLLLFALSAPFCRASLRRAGTVGVLIAESPLARYLGKLHRRPFLLVALLCILSIAVSSILAIPAFTLLGIFQVPFYLYIMLKPLLAAGLGIFATRTLLYAGMCSARSPMPGTILDSSALRGTEIPRRHSKNP